MDTSASAYQKVQLPLEERFYALSGKELAFFKAHTGIDNDDELKKHIMAVQANAYKIFGYHCIRRYAFLKLKISELPAYTKVLELPHERKGAILLDLGCCFGNDIRKAVDDGWPVEDVIASDLQQGFWDRGHELFKSTPESFPAAFVAADAFTIAPRGPFYEDPITPRPDLKTLTSLTPLQGHVSAVHASSLFHLFGEEKQLELAHRVATLLSPAPGSVIFGSHGGKPKKGFRVEARVPGDEYMFCHSPETWRDIWDVVFKKGTVRVEAQLEKLERPDLDPVEGAEFFFMAWSVTRL